MVPDTRIMQVVEKKQGFKYKEPEVNLWKVIIIIRYVKL